MKFHALCLALATFPALAAAQEAPADAPPPPPADETTRDDAPPAEDTQRFGANSVNVNLGGIALGAYEIQYMHLFAGTHGVFVEPYLELDDGDDSSASIYGANVGYRWHWSGQQNSGFLGLTAGYGIGSGEVTVTTNGQSETYDLDVTAFKLVPNIGYRWAFLDHFNVTIRGGVGYGSYSASTDSNDPDAQDAVETLDELLSFLPVAVDGEVSFGFIF